jgi:nicotinamidase-related amidase
MKKTLIVVDMQNDFIDGVLGTEEAVGIVENVKRKISEYQRIGGEIIFTRDTHDEGYMETNEGKYLPVKHCVRGTKGWEIKKELEISEAVYVDKPTFGYLQWKDYNLEEVELVGLCTDICVVSNALIIKAMYPEIKVSVDVNCCAGVTPKSHEAAITTMKMCQVEILGE